MLTVVFIVYRGEKLNTEDEQHYNTTTPLHTHDAKYNTF